MNTLQLLLLTITPTIELRGSLPIAIISHASIITYLLILLTNIAIGIIVFLFIEKIILIARKISFIDKLMEKYLDKSVKKLKKSIEKARGITILGIALFIGIPLPGTGVYTGGIASALINIDLRDFIIADVLGVVIASILVSIVTLGISGFIHFI